MCKNSHHLQGWTYAVNGFWSGRLRSLLEVRVSNPHTQSNMGNSLQKCCLKHEKGKNRMYEPDSYREMNTPLVQSAGGGFARELYTLTSLSSSVLLQP